MELPRPIELTGVTVVGDHRSVIPVQRALRVDLRDIAGVWKTTAHVTGATERDIRCHWDTAEKAAAIRIFVSASELPKSERPDIPDGVVRLVEVMAQLPDGSEMPLCDFNARQ